VVKVCVNLYPKASNKLDISTLEYLEYAYIIVHAFVTSRPGGHCNITCRISQIRSSGVICARHTA